MGKPTSLPFTFTSNVKAGFSRYKAVYRLVSGFGPDTITFNPSILDAPGATSVTTGSMSDGDTIILDVDTSYNETYGKKGDGKYGGSGSRVDGTFTMIAGVTYRARVGNVGAYFWKMAENINNCIMMGQEGGHR